MTSSEAPCSVSVSEPCSVSVSEPPAGGDTEQEYETQFLGFAPKSFCDGLYNAVSDYTWEHFRASQDYMKSQFQQSLKQSELQQASDTILATLNKAIDKAFDKFETYLLTNIMYLPKNVVLPEDAVHHKYRDWSPDQHGALDTDIQTLKDRIRAAKYLNCCLRQELQEVDLVQKEYNKFMDHLRLLERSVRETGVTDVHESLLFSLEKCDSVIAALRDIRQIDLAKLRHPLPGLDMTDCSKKVKLDAEDGNET